MTSSSRVPTGDPISLAHLGLDLDRRKAILLRVETGGLGGIQGHRALVAGAHHLGSLRWTDDLCAKQGLRAGGSARMIHVIVGEDDLRDLRGVQPLGAHVVNNAL